MFQFLFARNLSDFLQKEMTKYTCNQNIRFVPFGVQLTVLPTVTDGDRVRLQLQSTVSETSGGGGIGGGIGGIGGGITASDPSQPPSLSTRSFTSTVELRDGESLALAGLIRSSMVNSSARVPFLGDVPVIGNIFSNNESSTIIRTALDIPTAGHWRLWRIGRSKVFIPNTSADDITGSTVAERPIRWGSPAIQRRATRSSPSIK